jgi:hypothetical protein
MKNRLCVLVNVVLVLSLLLVSPVSAREMQQGLQPGETVTFQQEVPVNIVFIGYKKNAVNLEALRSQLPNAYQPIVRYPPFYGLSGRDLGLKFNFKYNLTFTENNFSNRFFNYLKQIGTPGDPTLYQQLYNDQKKNVLEVTGPVLYIDGPSVEAWLADNLKVAQKGYTIVFINWYGRPDFQFHVYTKTDEPDPDTEFNFGDLNSRKLIAWGGTSSRLWFYDLSAGPEWNTDNWNVDDPDLDGDGEVEYRMPPIWEYSQKGYRKPGALGKDLGLVARYVAINLLFTTSPLYDPLVTAPGVGGNKVIHINMFEDDPHSLGTDWIDTNYVINQLASFEPYYSWQVQLVDHNPIDDGARRAFRIFAEVREGQGCWEDFGTTFANLFCFFDQNRDQYIPAYGPQDYVIGVFAFNTTAARLGTQFGLLGYADDNWMDGTQTYVFEFDSAEYRDAGYGFSTTSTHEVGHHIGMSHPHDGFDSETGLDYGPGGEFYYVWVGDESDTVMSYLGLSNTFSQFDMDNLYRYEFAGYLNWANSILDDILAHPNAGDVADNVSSAQAYAEEAIESFQAWEYLNAAINARSAYEQIAMAASELGIPSEQELLRLAPAMIPPHEGDWIRPSD